MRSLLVPLLLFFIASCGNEAAKDTERVEVASAADSLRDDPRVSALLYDCAKEEYFGEDTSNLIPVLVGKLRDGQRDPMRAAKRDLAAAGELAIGELSRFVDAEMARGAAASTLNNALGAIALMDAPAGREIAWRLLDHPHESVRIAALRALKGRLGPDDFDRIAEFVSGGSVVIQNASIEPLFEADKERLFTLFESWIESESELSLWPPTVALLAREPAFTERGKRVIAALEDKELTGAQEVRAQFSALAAREGDAESLQFLRELLDHESFAFQYVAVEALAKAGLAEELRPVLRSNPDPKLRAIAAEAIGRLPHDSRWNDALSLGLSDEDESVRKASMKPLLARGDEAATDFALSLLEGSSADRQVALDALSLPMQVDEFLTAEAFRLLSEKVLEYADLSTASRVPFYQSIGQLPSADAARFLLDRADSEEGDIDGLEAHRWMVLQSGNTGTRGEAVLVERWRAASDPKERLDLISALFSVRDDSVRAIMSEAATREGVTPYEVLVASDFLSRVGPAEYCAPLLKRVALRCEDSDVRRALQCLLWRFYGA